MRFVSCVLVVLLCGCGSNEKEIANLNGEIEKQKERAVILTRETVDLKKEIRELEDTLKKQKQVNARKDTEIGKLKELDSVKSKLPLTEQIDTLNTQLADANSQIKAQAKTIENHEVSIRLFEKKLGLSDPTTGELLLSENGIGTKTTKSFYIPEGGVTLEYSYTGDSSLFQVMIMNDQNELEDFTVNESKNSNNDSTLIRLNPGNYYIKVNAICDWKIKVRKRVN